MIADDNIDPTNNKSFHIRYYNCWVLGSLPMWRKGPKFEKPMSHLNLVERRL